MVDGAKHSPRISENAKSHRSKWRVKSSTGIINFQASKGHLTVFSPKFQFDTGATWWRKNCAEISPWLCAVLEEMSEVDAKLHQFLKFSEPSFYVENLLSASSALHSAHSMIIMKCIHWTKWHPKEQRVLRTSLRTYEPNGMRAGS